MKKVIFAVLVVFAVVKVKGQDRAAEMEKVLAARPWMNRQVTSGGIRLEMRGIYVDSGLLWISLRAVNGAAIDFRSGGMRFSIRYRHGMRRRAEQETRLVCVVRREPAILRSDSTEALCYGLAPRVPGKSRQLVVQWVERNGDRRLVLRVSGKNVLQAKRLE